MRDFFFPFPLALSETVSTMVSAVLALLVFSGMMTFKGVLAASQLGTILGGYVGSIFFILILTVNWCDVYVVEHTLCLCYMCEDINSFTVQFSQNLPRWQLILILIQYMIVRELMNH